MRFWLYEGVKKGTLYVWKNQYILRPAGFRREARMKISYEFVTGEISEVEVDESLGGMLLDLDRQQYNNDQKETRRHVSLDGM